MDEARRKNPNLVKVVKVRMSERTGMLECVVSPVLEFQVRELRDRGVGFAAYCPEEIRVETREERYLNLGAAPTRHGCQAFKNA